MTKLTRLRHAFVEFIPEELEPGMLYISKRYATASHLCCCGCGLEVVTPFNPAKWHLVERDGRVSLVPSIGNWSFPCQSHYWLEGDRVRWAAAMSRQQIAAVQARDRMDTLPPSHVPEFWLKSALRRMHTAWMTAGAWIKKWLS